MRLNVGHLFWTAYYGNIVVQFGTRKTRVRLGYEVKFVETNLIIAIKLCDFIEKLVYSRERLQIRHFSFSWTFVPLYPFARRIKHCL